MENLFTTLANSLPKQPAASVQQAASPSVRPKSFSDTVLEWQKTQDPQLTSDILKKLRPTIDSALNTYAPGNTERLGIKAAKLALESLKTFDPGKGAEPSTYVFNSLRRLHRLNARTSAIIPQSESFAADRKRIKDLAARFEDDKGREPSLEELADLSGFSRRKVDTLLEDRTVINESATLSEDSKKDTLAKKDLTDNDYFEYVYSSVGPIDQKIMEWASGLHGKQSLSNNEIARRLRISPAAVSQRKTKLQRMLEDVRGLV